MVFDFLRGEPVLKLFRDKLRAVVRADELRRAMLCDGRLHQRDHVGRLEGPVGAQHMALAGVLVQDGQHAQGAAAHRGIGDKVPRPHMTAMRRLGRQPRRVPAAHQSAFGRRHPQPFHAPQTLHLAFAHAASLLGAATPRSADSRSVGCSTAKLRPSTSFLSPWASSRGNSTRAQASRSRFLSSCQRQLPTTTTRGALGGRG